MRLISKTSLLTLSAIASLTLAPMELQGQGYPQSAHYRSANVSGVSGARPVTAQASVMGLQKALTAFALDVGRMPTGAEGLNALIYPPPGVKNWRGPYISTNNWRPTFTDPWGSMYRYVVQGTGRQAIHYIISNGPDRLPGTRDDLSVQF